MTTENQDHPNEAAAADATADAQSTVTSEREVAPTHGGPGTNWASVVVAILAVIVFGILAVMFVQAIG